MSTLTDHGTHAADLTVTTVEDVSAAISTHPGRVIALLIGSAVTTWVVAYLVVTRTRLGSGAGSSTGDTSAESGPDDEGRPDK